MSIPCDDCLLVPVCRHKTTYKLLKDCGTIRTIEDNYLITMAEVEEALNPTNWTISFKERDR